MLPCGISDVNLPSFSQERHGFINTHRWSDPDCCDRLSIFGRLNRESCHLAPLMCHDNGGGKNLGGHHVQVGCSLDLDETAPQGATKRSGLIKDHAVLRSESLSSTMPDMKSKIFMGHYCPHGHCPHGHSFGADRLLSA